MEKENNQIDKLSKLLQNFGLQFIQSIGGLKHQLAMITDKVDNLSKEVIELKSMRGNITSLNNNLPKYFTVLNETLNNINNHVMDLEISGGINEAVEKITDSKVMMQKTNSTTPNTKLDVVFSQLVLQIEGGVGMDQIVSLLKQVREELFLITGGHPGLMEIKKIEKDVKSEKINREQVLEQIQSVSNKFQ